MKVIMISRDIKVLDRNSEVYSRMIEYANLFEELHIIVMGKLPQILDTDSNHRLVIYNATSKYKLVSLVKSFINTLGVARKIKSGDTWITSQDPFESGILALLIAKISKIKLQLQLHTDCFNFLYIRHGLRNLIRFNIARIILPFADSIRVVSEKVKSSLITFNSQLSTKISVLPIYTDITKLKTQTIETNLKERFPNFKKIILIVARLESEKNIELSIHAFQKALRFDDTLGLVIAGAGSKESWLKEYAKYLGVSDRVEFIGWQSDVVSLYKTSDILLVTSLYEGYGLNMVESMACGTPVVATDVGVAKEIGATVVPYDAGEIALKLVRILSQQTQVELPQKFITKKENYLELFKRSFK